MNQIFFGLPTLRFLALGGPKVLPEGVQDDAGSVVLLK